MTALTTEQANAVYDVLVEHAGADPADWREFEYVVVTCGLCRFQFFGHLGIGGMFRMGPDRWYVIARREDLTADRQQIIDVTNAALSRLRASYVEESS